MDPIELDQALVKGYVANDPVANVLVAFVAVNADPGSYGITTAAGTAASYIKPLAEAESSSDSTLIFEIDARDPETEECHSFSTHRESSWRAMLNRLRELEWEPKPSILVVVGAAGSPSGFRSHSPHIRAA